MDAIRKISDGKAVIWCEADVFALMSATMFDPALLREKGYYRGHKLGRHQVHFLRIDGREMVLRHYYRGGFVGRINRDLFMWEPVDRSRAMREFLLLQWMREQGLPVPRPLASRYVAFGIWYRADLITERIADARTLIECLHDAPLSGQDWQRIGKAIASMHRLGVDHTDLNCRNVLLDAGMQVWLVDFDNCRRRAKGDWQRRNLARLKRSLEKQREKMPGLPWAEADWSALTLGYGSDPF